MWKFNFFCVKMSIYWTTYEQRTMIFNAIIYILRIIQHKHHMQRKIFSILYTGLEFQLPIKINQFEIHFPEKLFTGYTFLFLQECLWGVRLVGWSLGLGRFLGITGLSSYMVFWQKHKCLYVENNDTQSTEKQIGMLSRNAMLISNLKRCIRNYGLLSYYTKKGSGQFFQLISLLWLKHMRTLKKWRIILWVLWGDKIRSGMIISYKSRRVLW